jgi:hypothetical protein
MSIYKTEEGLRFNTETAKESWKPSPRDDQRSWQHLYLSSKGRYFVITHSLYEDDKSTAVVVSDREAAEWLLDHGYELPEDLAGMLDELVE